MNPGPSVQ
ncbi:hypothetical protein SEUBUCD646_0H02240 [Saccharomyces eubayanus]|uniref:Uncharacterized protein n=1 Tax=Saccharomyces eubayanus TaxID=1080349 RepID=A0ABN8VUJ0_SACEU|nr:hypothetical protein SEUBUCD650_0L03360 [Saccharomyces eubayanus]CAI1619718.1 hypothetical protein SEUBUCD646_0L03370 [Saccharomyces eubayanus]CAI2026435.1 hypothetical protein SEUBUCD650_0H02250 [Saccharomyces eubayanus]CAI2040862.1 hypothetical protein SEUBUCD646_0H02240 [Saccharomyces eubayanus]